MSIPEIHKTFSRSGSLIQLIGLLAVCVGLSTFAAAAQTSETNANIQVSQHWRGAYDILVRPASASQQAENHENLVEGNYLDVPAGGITLDQYDVIKSLSDVDVAAPVATVGYIHNMMGTVNWDFTPEFGTLYRLEITLSQGEHLIDQQVAYTAQIRQYGPDSSGEEKYAAYYNYGSSPILISGEGRILAYMGDLPPLWTLVTGIDPEQESKLVGLDKAVHGDPLPTNFGYEVDSSTHEKSAAIPVWINERSFLDLNAHVKIETAAMSDPQSIETIANSSSMEDPQTSQQLQHFFDSLPGEIVQDQTIDFDRAMQPLRQLSFLLSPDRPVKIAPEGVYFSTGTEILLYPSQIDYKISQPVPMSPEMPTFEIDSRGQWGKMVEPTYEALFGDWDRPTKAQVPSDSPIYRILTPYKTPPTQLKIYGTYDFERLGITQDPLSYVPLGIYEPPQAVLRYDTHGNPVNAQILKPDLNPGGFIPGPPLALTTLQGAQYLTGREDFIDAIRVRVKNVDAYTPNNLEKIERVAQDIVNRTGLQVNIVAGSSPQKVLVKVPDLGYVEERWTTLGTTLSITNGINAANSSLLGCMLLCATLFIVNGSQVSILGRRSEIGLLKVVGWRTVQIRNYLLRDSLRIGLVASVFAGLLSVVLILSLSLTLNLWVILGVTLAAPLLYLGASLPAINGAASGTPVKTLVLGEVNVHRHDKHSVRISFPALAWRELMGYRVRSFFSLSILGVGIALAYLVIGVVIGLQGKLQLTLLGESVVLRIHRYHILMIIAALSMGVLAIIENLHAGVVSRRNSFPLLLALGWRRKDIFRVVLWEGLILGFLGGLIGIALGYLILVLLNASLPANLLIIYPVLLLGAMILGGLSSLYPAFIAVNENRVRGLSETRAEPAGFRRLNGRYLGLIFSMILITLLGVMMIGGNPQKVETALGIGGTPEPTSLPAIAAVSPQPILAQIDKLSGLGERNLGNEAEKKAAEQLRMNFSEFGLDVQRLPVALSTVQVTDAQGQIIQVIPSLPIQGGEIAYHRKLLKVDQDLRGQLLFLPMGAELPPEGKLSDKIVLLEVAKNDYSGERLRNLITHYQGKVPCLAVLSVSLIDDRENLLTQLNGEGLQAQLRVGEDLIATLPGKLHPEQEIWLVAHYDSRSGSPGADQGASGPAALVELARIFSSQSFPYTIRFIALDGTYSGREGVVDFLDLEETKAPQVNYVIELDQLGNWEKMSMSADLSGQDTSLEDIARLKQEGQYFVQKYRTSRINLDRPELIQWMASVPKQGGGLSETPPGFRQIVQEAASDMDIPLQPYVYSPCTLTGHVFLSRGYPTVMLCGQGNGLAGTEYDTAQSLNSDKIQKSIGLIYMILQRIGTQP